MGCRSAEAPTDIFPDIDIPVMSVIWNYGGLQPDDMEKRIVNNFERFLTTTVNDIEHVESQSLTGIAVIKIYLPAGREHRRGDRAGHGDLADRRAIDAARHSPPLIIRYSASNVPILQIALESDTLSEQQLFDYGMNFVRTDIATVPGAQIPYPYGGKQRQIMVDIDPQRLLRVGPVAARRDQAAISAQNVMLPTRHREDRPQGISDRDQLERRRRSTRSRSMPIKNVNGTTVYITRRRERARRLRPTDQPRPRRGQALGPDDRS